MLRKKRVGIADRSASHRSFLCIAPGPKDAAWPHLRQLFVPLHTPRDDRLLPGRSSYVVDRPQQHPFPLRSFPYVNYTRPRCIPTFKFPETKVPLPSNNFPPLRVAKKIKIGLTRARRKMRRGHCAPRRMPRTRIPLEGVRSVQCRRSSGSGVSAGREDREDEEEQGGGEGQAEGYSGEVG